jgi:hypothetical protein
MNTYLSSERIKTLKSYLTTVLPNKTRTTLLNIKLKTGLELYYDTKSNKQLFWDYIQNEVRNLNNSVSVNFNSEMQKGNFNNAVEIIKSYIDSQYKNEWQTVCELNDNPQYLDGTLRTSINEYIKRFCDINKAQSMNIKDIIESQSIDDYLKQYSRENVDPEILKKTETIKKAVDSFYKDIQYNSNEYWIFNNAVNEYLQNKDEQQLHNLLHSEY